MTVIPALLAIFSFSPACVSAQELLLLRNIAIEDPENLRISSAGKKRGGVFFRPGDRIVAVFDFPRQGREGWIEFRWMKRFGSSRIEQGRYLHRVPHGREGGRYAAYSWMIIDPSWTDTVLGSKHAGEWCVEVFMDGRKEGEAHFHVGNR